MTTNGKLVYIVILNFNNYYATINTIESCLNQTYKNLRVLLVDNNSDQKCYDDLVLKYDKKIEFLRLDKNYGYAEGNNMGVKYSLSQGSNYSLILNNDTYLVGNELVGNLISAIEYSDNIVAVNPIILNKVNNGYKAISTSSYYVKLLLKFKVISSYGVVQNSAFKEVQLIHGSAVLVRNDIFVKLGGFPKEYFMYNEENVFSLRANLLGYKLLQISNGDECVLHNHIKNNLAPWKIYLMGRNFELSKSIFLRKRNLINILHSISNTKLFLMKTLKFDFRYIRYYRKGIINARKLKNSSLDEIYINALENMRLK